MTRIFSNCQLGKVSMALFTRTDRLILSLVLILMPIISLSQSTQTMSDPGPVGLTLSGGGARGLAHVGVLHVIDSAGVRIDYINGTSMGSIGAAMYAAGYTVAEIESFALSMDWNGVFGRFGELENVHPRHRSNFERNIAELPFDEGRFIIKTGVIEGQQLWNILNEVFFHVRHIDDFSTFNIPFSCVATDIETGDAVIIQSGDIVSAIRASIAIPAVFTAVERDDRKLVDGGVVNNFPADVIRDMGAEYVIGVNVSQGLRPGELLLTPLDIIYQMGFFLNAVNFRVNKELVNIFIEPDLTGFTVASFNDAAEIIERGKKAARIFYPDLVKLAQAQQAATPGREPSENANYKTDRTDVNASDSDTPEVHDQTVPRKDFIVVESVAYNGLVRVKEDFISDLISIRTGDTLRPRDLTRITNRMFSTGYFSRINYDINIKDPDDRVGDLNFSFYESPFTKVSAALHYNSFLGVGLIGGLSMNKFLLYNLSAEARARIGEKPAIYAGLDLFIDDRQKTWLNSSFSGDYFSFEVHENFEAVARYSQGYTHFETTINRTTGRRSYIAGGAAYYYQRLSPGTRSDIRVEGRNSGFKSFIRWKMHSVNRHAFPERGQRGSLSASWFFNQKPSLDITDQTGAKLSMEDVGINIGNFLQARFNWESYIQITDRMTSFSHFQGGYNFNYEQGFINMFNVGGIEPYLRDQIAFAGLTEYSMMTSSIFAGSIGWQNNVWDRFYLTPVFNAAVYDFELPALMSVTRDNFIFGASLDFGFLTSAGPLRATFSYSLKTNRLLAFVNFGWSF
jgi:NTE family protein